MKIFSYSLTRVSQLRTLKTLINPPTHHTVPGLVHAECSYCMTLGAPILSPSRYRVNHLAMFAAWESADALEDFFAKDSLGQILGRGWHVRMKFLRRWGEFGPFKELPLTADEIGSTDPVVAVTIARMKVLEVPRFIHWGRPSSSWFAMLLERPWRSRQ